MRELVQVGTARQILPQNTVGMFEVVQAKAFKRVLAEQIEESMVAANISKVKMAEMMATSRSQLDRVLDPDNVAIQLDTLMKAANPVYENDVIATLNYCHFEPGFTG